jgi:hypothetical protein
MCIAPGGCRHHGEGPICKLAVPSAWWVGRRAKRLAADATATNLQEQDKARKGPVSLWDSNSQAQAVAKAESKGSALALLHSSVGEAHGRLTPSETKFENYTDQRGTSLLLRSLLSLSAFPCALLLSSRPAFIQVKLASRSTLGRRPCDMA